MGYLNFELGLFWDIDVEKLDLKVHSRYIIERVLKYGSLNDWLNLKKIYSLDKIKEESLQIRSLDEKTLNFLSTYFDIDKSLFRCYN